MPVLIESIYFDFYLLHLSKGLFESAVIKRRGRGRKKEKEGGRARLHLKPGKKSLTAPKRTLLSTPYRDLANLLRVKKMLKRVDVWVSHTV